MLHDDLLYPLANVAHRCNLVFLECILRIRVRLSYFKCVDQQAWFSTSRSSKHRHAAVYVQRMPGHISRLVGGQVNGRSSDIAAGTEPAGGNPNQDGLTLLVIELVGHGARD